MEDEDITFCGINKGQESPLDEEYYEADEVSLLMPLYVLGVAANHYFLCLQQVQQSSSSSSSSMSAPPLKKARAASRCGHCGEVGHTKPTCPVRRALNGEEPPSRRRSPAPTLPVFSAADDKYDSGSEDDET